MKTYPIKVHGTVTLQLTGEEVADLHDRLTTLYNENYDEIHN